MYILFSSFLAKRVYKRRQDFRKVSSYVKYVSQHLRVGMEVSSLNPEVKNRGIVREINGDVLDVEWQPLTGYYHCLWIGDIEIVG